MPIKTLLNSKELTDVESVMLSLSFRSGLDTRDADAMSITINRKVGDVENADADQAAFDIMKGEQSQGGVTTFPMSIEFIDKNKKQPFGKWEFEEAIITSVTVADTGGRIQESISLAGNGVEYTPDGTQKKTKKLDVLTDDNS